MQPTGEPGGRETETEDDALRVDETLEQGLVQALVAFRWLALVWMTAVVVVSRRDLAHSGWAVALIALTLAVTIAQTVAAQRRDLEMVRRLVLYAELPVGVLLVALDGTIYAVDQSNSFGSPWPLAGVMAAGALFGRRAGVLAGLAIGAARLVSDLTGPGLGDRWLSLVSTTVLFVIAGWASGELYRRLADDVPALTSDQRRALSGAIGECLTNAAKHGGAGRATVYAEPVDEGGVFCSVKDDGQGYDTGAVTEGSGLTRSVRGRVEGLGGRVEVDGRPGRGTEVSLWLANS